MILIATSTFNYFLFFTTLIKKVRRNCNLKTYQISFFKSCTCMLIMLVLKRELWMNAYAGKTRYVILIMWWKEDINLPSLRVYFHECMFWSRERWWVPGRGARAPLVFWALAWKELSSSLWINCDVVRVLHLHNVKWD